MAAGRVMLARLRELAAARANFAFETTLATRSFAPWIRELVDQGYEFHLVFFWLPSAEIAAQRVASRVRAGGHDVPRATIERRYRAGLANLTLYFPLATSWRVVDNHLQVAEVIAYRHAGATHVVRPPAWTEFVSQQRRADDQKR